MSLPSWLGRALAVAMVSVLALGCQSTNGYHPMTYHNGSPWTEATVNGRTGKFLVDTGASITVVDVAMAERVGLQQESPREVLGTAGRMSASTALADYVRVAGRRHNERLVAIIDLAGFVAPGGRQQDGLLGCDFMVDYTVVFDMARSLIALRQGPAPHASRMRPHRMVLDGGSPMLDVWFPGENAPRWARLDTGSSFAREANVYLDMAEPLARQLLGAKLDTAPDFQIEVVSITGPDTLDVYTAGPFTILGKSLPEVRIVVRRNPRGAFAQQDFLLISGSLLRQFDRVELDFPRRTAWVRE